MGHSEFDPAAKNRRPWNAGRKSGGKPPFEKDEVALRDQFWRICFGEDPTFWSHAAEETKRVTSSGISANDNVAVCMALLLRSEDSSKINWNLKNVAGGDRLIGLDEGVKPRRLQQAINQIRIAQPVEDGLLARLFTSFRIFRQQFADAPSLGTLLPAMDDIKAHFH